MKYYLLIDSIDIKQVGNIPQVTKTTEEIGRKELTVYQTLNRRELPENLPKLDIFKLDKKAKLTDMLSCTFLQLPNGIVVNEKVKTIWRIIY